MAPRTQCSLAVSSDGARWLLLGASPDVRTQLEHTPSLWPTADGRSPVRGVALHNGDIDAWAGLLTLREWAPMDLYATNRVRRDLVEHNAVLRTLDRFEGHTRWHDLAPGEPQAFDGGLTVEAIPSPGQAPLHFRSLRPSEPLDNVALRVSDGKTSIAWCPAVGSATPALEALCDGVDHVFFDGTFSTDDELVKQGRGRGLARDMGHWPLVGEDGSLAWLSKRRAKRKTLVHINNTNPILVDDGPERAHAKALGIEVGVDGWSDGCSA
ncbi:MAG: MBL fold metallo-hydrolase [Polyangia bacterium]